MQEPSEPTWPPYRSRERHGWRGDPDWRPGAGWPHRARRWRHRGNGEPLRRDPEDRLAGVAAGIADYLNVDVTLIRIAFVVFTFLGGAGIPAYLACLLLIPEEGTDQSIAGSLFDSFQHSIR